MKIVGFDKETMVLEDGTELPICIPFNEDITLKELNKLYEQTCKFIESCGTLRSNN